MKILAMILALSAPLADSEVSSGFGYYLFPRLNSKLQSTASIDGQPERNNIFMREFA